MIMGMKLKYYPYMIMIKSKATVLKVKSNSKHYQLVNF
jgi:hypothetical protein